MSNHVRCYGTPEDARQRILPSRMNLQRWNISTPISFPRIPLISFLFLSISLHICRHRKQFWHQATNDRCSRSDSDHCFRSRGAVQGTFYGWERFWAGKKWDFDELKQSIGTFLSGKMRCWLADLLGLRSGWLPTVSRLLRPPNRSDPEGKEGHRYATIRKFPM